MSNANFEYTMNRRDEIRRRFISQLEFESGIKNDNNKYKQLGQDALKLAYIKLAQLREGPGKKFDYFTGNNYEPLEGLKGSNVLEDIRREIDTLPPAPRRGAPLPPQTGGRKRKATKKARRNMRRQTKKANNMRRQRGGGA